MLRFLFALTLALGLAPNPSRADSPPPSPLDIDSSIRAVLEAQKTDPIARTAYADSPRQFLWIASGHPTDAAREVAAQLAMADADGLRPEDYQAAALSDALGTARASPGGNLA